MTMKISMMTIVVVKMILDISLVTIIMMMKATSRVVSGSGTQGRTLPRLADIALSREF